MTTEQINKLEMYYAVHVLLQNRSEMGALPALPPKIAALGASLVRIEELAQEQALPLGGVIATRDATLQAAIDAALTIGGLARSYAQERKLGDFAEQVRVKPSHFDLRYERRLALARSVYEAVAPEIAQLEGYVTPAMLEDFKQTLDDALEALTRPRGAMVARKVAGQMLAAEMKAVDELLAHHLDAMLLALRGGHPGLYDEYRGARVILRRRGSRRAAQTKADNASESATLAGATDAIAVKTSPSAVAEDAIAVAEDTVAVAEEADAVLPVRAVADVWRRRQECLCHGSTGIPAGVFSTGSS